MSADSSLVAHYGVLTKGITSLCFHPNGKHVLATSRSGGTLLYNIEKQSRPFTFQARGFSPVRGIIAQDGDSVYCSSIEGKLGLWRIHKPQPNLLKTAHPSRINDFDIWKQNGVIVTASNDKSMKLWTPSLEFITSFPDHNSQVSSCACCPTADVILSGDITGTLTMWDVRDKTKVPVWRKSVRVKGRNSVTSVAFDHTGVLFCTSTEDGKLAVWDRRASETALAGAKYEPSVIQAHDVPAGHAVFHPKRPMVLVAGTDNMPRIFDLEMSSLLYSFEGHDQPTCGCAWAGNGTLFATADTDGHILVWKMPRTRVIPTIVPRTEDVPQPIEQKKPSKCEATPEALLRELDQMNARARQLNEHLVVQEKRLTSLAARYQC